MRAATGDPGPLDGTVTYLLELSAATFATVEPDLDGARAPGWHGVAGDDYREMLRALTGHARRLEEDLGAARGLARTWEEARRAALSGGER